MGQHLLRSIENSEQESANDHPGERMQDRIDRRLDIRGTLDRCAQCRAGRSHVIHYWPTVAAMLSHVLCGVVRVQRVTLVCENATVLSQCCLPNLVAPESHEGAVSRLQRPARADLRPGPPSRRSADRGQLRAL